MKKFLTLLFFCTQLTAQNFENPEPLRFSDIKTIMKELFSKHVEQKNISGEILEQSFQNYINQADPEKIYFLQEEVTPWVDLSDMQILQLLNDYRKSDFSAYKRLNDQVQKNIKRSRALREEIYRDPTILFYSHKPEHHNSSHFAENEQDLKARLQSEIILFIDRQKERFGEQAVLDRQETVLKQFEKSIRSFEERYLFENKEQEENLLAMHVLKAMAKSLDSNTAFFSPLEAYDMKVRLEKGFYGVGIIFQEDLDGVTVRRIIPDSAADKDGKVALNDRLIAIDQESIFDDSFIKVLRKIHIDDDNEITFTFAKANDQEQTYDVTLTREPIEVDSKRVDISYEPFGKGIIGVLKLYNFYDSEDGITAEFDIREAIRYLEGVAPLKGLVLDLRDNNGGFLMQAVKVAGLFITNGVVVISKYANGEERTYRDIDGKTSFDGPLVVLVSDKTASAAEIVAQALQDYGVALVVGDEKTYGKGSIQSQTVTGEKGSSYFKVTVGKYYTVSGKTPDKHGVQSDIVVPNPSKEKTNTTDLVETYPADQVASAFDDSLDDVKEEVKPWFLKYYAPTIQNQTDQWTRWIPILKENSKQRLEKDKNWIFLTKGTTENGEDELEESYVRKGTKNAGAEDLQLQEALLIVKDMIKLDAKNPNDMDKEKLVD